MTVLKFSPANAKLEALEKLTGKLYSFSLLSGHTCPFAKDCRASVEIIHGKKTVVDGPHTIFRCFSASQEALYPSVYDQRMQNTVEIKACDNRVNHMQKLIAASIPADAKCIRIHIGGDFFTKNYMIAWYNVAKNMPSVRFYAYTKSVPMVIALEPFRPDNMILTVSRGGLRDDLIDAHKLREAVVVFTEKEAADKGLEIDHDDSHAAFYGPSFALLVHGVQPKGSVASKAMKALNGVGSYSRKKGA